MKGRIKIGARIGQDFRYFRWPECGSPVTDPNMVFEVSREAGGWKCKADGFGMLKIDGEVGEYGNGCIYVRDRDGVEFIDGPPSWLSAVVLAEEIRDWANNELAGKTRAELIAMLDKANPKTNTPPKVEGE